VLLFSFEMTKMEITERAFAKRATSTAKASAGGCTRPEVDAAHSACRQDRRLPLWLETSA
jgi:hypothetical protein